MSVSPTTVPRATPCLHRGLCSSLAPSGVPSPGPSGRARRPGGWLCLTPPAAGLEGLWVRPRSAPPATGVWTSHRWPESGATVKARKAQVLGGLPTRARLTSYPAGRLGAGRVGRQGGRCGCTPPPDPTAPPRRPGRQAGGHSPCSQWTPVLPGGQVHVPVPGSQAVPGPHLHTWAQLGPKRPCGQAAGRKWEGGRPWLDPFPLPCRDEAGRDRAGREEPPVPGPRGGGCLLPGSPQTLLGARPALQQP